VGELTQLWQRYASSAPDRRQDLRRQLIEAYAPLARYVVDRMNLRPGPALGYEDLLSQAVVGVIDAIDRFDPARGVKFETYAYHRVRGAVMDMLRDMDWLPRSVRQRESELAAAYTRLEGELGRQPTDEELAQTLGLTIEGLDELARDVALQSMQSLDEALGGYAAQAWEAATLADVVPDGASPSPEDHVEGWAERDLIAKAIDTLPDSERTVISLYYHEGLTLKEIGRVLGVTESRACQIHGKALVRLRGHVRSVVAGEPEAAAQGARSAGGRLDGMPRRPAGVPQPRRPVTPSHQEVTHGS